jgi:ribosomal protein L14E/L6E/L27E
MKHQSFNRFEAGQLARSKQGRDKEHLYVVVGKDSRFLYVADGQKWTVSNPKKKNSRHLQLINLLVTDGQQEIGNTEIIQAIEAFENRKGN